MSGSADYPHSSEETFGPHFHMNWLKYAITGFRIQCIAKNIHPSPECLKLKFHMAMPSLSGEPDYFGRNEISSGGDLSHYSSASLY